MQGLKLNKFITSDLALGATLISCGIELDSMDRSDIKKVKFYFTDSDRLQEVVKDFWRDSLKISPRQYWDNLRALKGQIYGN